MMRTMYGNVAVTYTTYKKEKRDIKAIQTNTKVYSAASKDEIQS
jgi:hypothetical protein